jgi:hypothetical protein
MHVLGFSREDSYALLVVIAILAMLAIVWTGTSGLEARDKLSASAVLVSALGVVFTFWQAERSRRKQNKLELLRKAYQAIEEAFARDYDENEWYREKEKEWTFAFENAIRDLQLMASRKIAGLAYAYTHNFDDPTNREALGRQLLLELRNELRREMGEGYIPDFPRSLRHHRRVPPSS